MFTMADLPDELMLRIFMVVGKRDLLNLRRVSHSYNTIVLDTPLGIAWEYSLKLAKSTAKRTHYGLPVEQPIHSGMNLGGTILSLLYHEHQKEALKRRKVKKMNILDRATRSLPSWLRVEMHKRQVANQLRDEFESEVSDEVFEHAEKVTYTKLYSPAPSKPGVMVSQFVIPLEKLQKAHGVTKDLVLTCEWEARSVNIGDEFTFHQLHCVSFSLGFSFGTYGPPEYSVFEYNDTIGDDFSINKYSITVLWDLLGVRELGRCEIMRMFNILAVAGYVEEEAMEFTWWMRDDISDSLEMV